MEKKKNVGRRGRREEKNLNVRKNSEEEEEEKRGRGKCMNGRIDSSVIILHVCREKKTKKKASLIIDRQLDKRRRSLAICYRHQ